MGKTIVITCASLGIGLATVKKFLNFRWHVIGTYNNNLIEFNAENLTTLRLDLSSLESIKSVSLAMREKTGVVKFIKFFSLMLEFLQEKFI
ncbi:MAG: hypothetical protein V1860_02345 [bacterium]